MATCKSCLSELAMHERFCPRCGADSHVELMVEAFHGPALRSARGWILAVGILYGVGGLLLYTLFKSSLGRGMGDRELNILLGTNFALLAIHIGLWVWAKKSPYAAAVVAFVLFVTVHVANAAMDPHTIYQGILIKILFIVALVKAMSAGKKAQELRASARGAIV